MSSFATPAAAPRRILLVQSSGRRHGSTTRALGRELADRLAGGDASLIVLRDVADGLPLVDDAWIAANFADPAERSDAQKATLALSDALIAELQAADDIILAAPVYNFGVPAALKSWIDQIARARVTFKYTENGPVGLLEGKRGFVVSASGGTELGSTIDFATGYLRHIFGFIGVKDVTLVGAGQAMARGEAAAEDARRMIATIPA